MAGKDKNILKKGTSVLKQMTGQKDHEMSEDRSQDHSQPRPVQQTTAGTVTPNIQTSQAPAQKQTPQASTPSIKKAEKAPRTQQKNTQSAKKDDQKDL